MCGRYTWKATNGGKFKKLVKATDIVNEPSYNRAPGQTHPSISIESGSAQWTNMIWGNPRPDSLPSEFFPINARSETVHEKTIFKESFLHHRCLIPSDGWFEWQIIEDQKYPHHISSEKNETFAFAGIWRNINQKKVFSILTRKAASNIFHIHHRAPLALTEDYWTEWLDEKKAEESLSLLMQIKQPPWKATQVSSRVNSTRNNDPELLKPEKGKQSLLF